jgi:hypothetical protein
MSQTLSAPSFPPAGLLATAPRPGLSALIYRSRAVQSLSAPDLLRLTQQAQARNRRESITGLVVYDSETFFQWLEGPAANVARLMGSIRNDPRHTDIEIIDDQSVAGRRFGEWDMKLAARLPSATLWQSEIIDPPTQVIEALHMNTDIVPALLATLVPCAGAAPRMHRSKGMIDDPVLDDVIRAAVIPELARRLGADVAMPQRWTADRRAAELARLLVAADPRAAHELIRDVLDDDESIRPLYGRLIEPAARGLGDLWSDDLCSEAEVTLGLARLQSSVRLLGGAAPIVALASSPPRRVLVAPEPGERHLLGAALDADMLHDAGWAPHCAFPADDAALSALLSDRWFDVLDLSLSVAFQREHWLARMARTIVLARRASRNPALMVVVSGRIFVEQRDACQRVGADAASMTALQIAHLVLKGLGKGRGALAC